MKIFTNIIKQFRSSIFIEYVPMFLVLALIFVALSFLPERISPVTEESVGSTGLTSEKLAEVIMKMESEQPLRITGNETEKEMYNNPYITYIRTALNGYLDGSNVGTEEIVAMEQGENFNMGDGCGLNQYRSYLSGPFFIYDVADNKYGGIQAWIVFKNKPDTLFWAWVYQFGWDSGEYSLRGFCKAGPPEEKQEEFIELMQSYIESDNIGFTL